MNQNNAESFKRNGYVICRNFADKETLQRINDAVDDSLLPPLGPLEFEVDVQYPGSPTSYDSPGGYTPRRFLNAYSRSKVFREWASNPNITSMLKELLGSQGIQVSQNHHNCFMTKYPGYSSATLWHQDQRYWSFDRPDLVSVWLAVGHENKNNGCLRAIPESHNMEFDRGQFDAALFFREDLDENIALMDTAVDLELNPGDVLFFHSKTLHAANHNAADKIKKSLVFTYHCETNKPIPHTRSAKLPDIKV